MAEPLTVVAIVHPAPGKGSEVAETYREVADEIHAEPGCELYAVHPSQDEQTVVVIERWTTLADLEAHLDGPAIARLTELNQGLRAAPSQVIKLDPIPMGDPAKGVLG